MHGQNPQTQTRCKQKEQSSGGRNLVKAKVGLDLPGDRCRKDKRKCAEHTQRENANDGALVFFRVRGAQAVKKSSAISIKDQVIVKVSGVALASETKVSAVSVSDATQRGLESFFEATVVSVKILATQRVIMAMA